MKSFTLLAGSSDL